MAEDSPETVSVYEPREQEVLSLDSRFKFECREGLACFNQCCRTPTIILSPYDIMRLKQGLGITSGEFLRRYTLKQTEERSNLPLIFLDAFSSPGRGCPFVGENGCKVYAHRPAACRLFPITMGSQLTEHGVVDYYFCRRLDFCRGFEAEVEWTVASWQANQGFAEYDQGRREWLEILLKKELQGPAESDARVQKLFSSAAYDLDRFRRMIAEPGFLGNFEVNERELAELQESDAALLQFSYRFLKAVLFPEETRRAKAD